LTFDQLAFETLEHARGIGSLAAIAPVFGPAFAAAGFDHFAFGLMPSPGRRHTEFVHGVFDLGLMRHGLERGFPKRDAAYELSRSSGAEVLWSDLDPAQLEPSERQMIQEAGEWGVREGFVLATQEGAGAASGVFMTSWRPRPDYGAIRKTLARLAARYSATVHRFLPASLVAPQELTARQMECLKWALQGKSAVHIGEMLGLSPRTVEEHFAEACKRLGVRNRVQAVARAVLLGIITD
jgi:LuxR family quorum sensing-dependent transcriptional regulator